MRIKYLWSLLLWLALVGCDFTSNPVPERTTHQTEHFKILYYAKEYSNSAIKDIGLKKEGFLARMNEILDIKFEGVITTTIYNYNITSYTDASGNIHESRYYVKNDNGHEIVHSVTIAELGGHSTNSFLVEGLAVAVADSMEMENSIFNLMSTISFGVANNGDSLWLEQYPSIPEQITKYEFGYSSFEYIRAGAFVYYLMTHYGINKLKELYKGSTSYMYHELYEDMFLEIYNESLEEVYEEFVVELSNYKILNIPNLNY